MAPDSHVVLLTFPARAISPDVSQWLALAGDITGPIQPTVARMIQRCIDALSSLIILTVARLS